MLPRSQMYKPAAGTALPHLGRAFTDIQELKQVAAGTSMIHRSLESFMPSTVSTIVLLDLHGYDAFPALAALEEVSDGKRTLCGTVVLDASDQITQRVANTLYDKCRSKALSLPQFPDFQPLLQALKQGDSASVSRQYNVCVRAQDRLVILESFASKFVNSEITKDKCEQAITNHNEKYNTGGEYWAQETRSGESAPEPPTKKIKIEPTDMFKESDVSSLQHPHKLSINNAAELLTDGTGELLYLISRGKNTFNQHRELFSFGSGEWREASEADEVMQDTSGRWYPFVVSTETLLCLEKQGLPEHLQQLPSIESPVAVSSLLAEMEDSGEASGICEKGFYCGPPF
ncbi:Uncharacterized protein SCF082_LOCUS47637 [Durusdinium trenchii]|uniref:Uncharacterized protein n=1 Tax=Durusdinium trenchii TaxID=1381693 RepID=A0ABP0RRR4_9DINO